MRLGGLQFHIQHPPLFDMDDSSDLTKDELTQCYQPFTVFGRGNLFGGGDCRVIAVCIDTCVGKIQAKRERK